jgi:two-component system chemotaxis response regulator CheB
MIRVLVADDSAVLREALIHILSGDAALEVVGTAKDGQEAVEVARQQRPDVITMDINMPRLDGFEATRQIMETQPTPIIIVTGSVEPGTVATSFRAVEAGAVAVVTRPPALGHPDYATAAQELVQTVKLMAEVKVVRRWARNRRNGNTEQLRPTPPPAPKRPPDPNRHTAARTKVVAIGASTGGPLTLQTVLSALPNDFPVPILVVQHIASGFVGGFAEWLEQTCGRPVHLAANGVVPQPGHVYVAPEGSHLKVEMGGRLALTHDEPENGLRPAVGYLFRSVAEVYGASAIGVLLTGMGKDGAEELKLMRSRGATTLAQDAASSVVHGMPGEAIRLEAADYILSPEAIGATLAELASRA